MSLWIFYPIMVFFLIWTILGVLDFDRKISDVYNEIKIKDVIVAGPLIWGFFVGIVIYVFFEGIIQGGSPK